MPLDDVLRNPSEFLQDEVYGDVLPAPPPGEPTVVLLPEDGRDLALDRFRLFLSKLRFTRYGDYGERLPWNLDIDHIYDEQPPDPSRLDMPCISFIPGVCTFEALGLGPGNVIEESRDQFGAGFVLMESSNASERFQIEVWASSSAQRRSIKSGIVHALQSLATSGGCRIKVPLYYGQVVNFTLVENQNVDNDDVVRNRRTALISVELNFISVTLVRYAEFKPSLNVNVKPSGSVLSELPKPFP